MISVISLSVGNRNKACKVTFGVEHTLIDSQRNSSLFSLSNENQAHAHMLIDPNSHTHTHTHTHSLTHTIFRPANHQKSLPLIIIIKNKACIPMCLFKFPH
ncbi:hypothetical protein L6452_07445 [Arctium lappa]|uniref:Uncharacterized protein n=1 Tax=Arctium lappa TaxID=4217 RepID=A0ACB9EM77_ARCLA|nr:hypothetical protein L6452_07445 [Arctium lappa]